MFHHHVVILYMQHDRERKVTLQRIEVDSQMGSYQNTNFSNQAFASCSKWSEGTVGVVSFNIKIHSPSSHFLVLQQAAAGARAQVRLHWIELLSSCCTICHPDWCTLHPAIDTAAWCIFLAPAHHIKISSYTLPTKPRRFCTRWRKIELGRV